MTSPFDLKLIVFPGAPNLPVFAAMEKGFFEQAGVRIDLTTTPSSTFQVEGLVSGKFHIAGTAFDNVVAYQEGQGAVALDRKPDLFAFMGATQIELSLVVSPDVRTYADLKGKSLALDAVSTGFAFVLYRMLERAGLASGDCEMVPVGATPQRWESVKAGTHAGTITIEPFTSIARNQGFRVLDTSFNAVDCYQGGSFAASRGWAARNPDALKGYIRGYLDGLAWTLDPENREKAAEMLLRNMPVIKPGVVEAVLNSLLSPRSGLTPGGRILMDGVRTVLELRSSYGTGSEPLTDPDRYIDLSYYEEVMPKA